MAYQVNTAQANAGEEDNEGSSSTSNKPTLKEFLSREMGQSGAQILTNLESKVGITDIDSLIFIFEGDLNELCQALGLPFGDKIRFKAAVSKLQHTFKPKQPQTIVTISPKEQSRIDQIDMAMKQSNGLQTLFQKHLNQIDDHIASAESQVNTQIDAVIESLQLRKKALHQNLNEWKLGKLDAINKEMANIWEYHNALKSAKRGIDDLLRKPGGNRDKKIEGIVGGLLRENDKYKVYQDDTLQKYVINNTKMIGVTFQDKMEMKQLELYVELDPNAKNDLLHIPSILLEERKSTLFAVKRAVNNNDDDSDKKELDQIEEGAKMDRKVLDEPPIEQEEKNKFSLDGIKCLFQIEKIVNQPILLALLLLALLLIMSSLTSTIFEGKWLDMSKEEQISLKIGSHSGHYGTFVSERILRSDDEYYLSPSGQITNQWIILNVDNDATYYPTKLQVRARGTNNSSSNGDLYALKRFALKIGNTDRNEWIQLNEELFVASKMDTNLQTFNLDIVNNNNGSNRIVQKWKSIKSKNLKHLKLELLDNYGDCYILIQEFKLFGVKV
eukprot:332344_1